MKNNKHIGAATLLLALLGTSTYSFAEEVPRKSKHALGTSINSFGLGAFYTYKFNDNLHLRATVHGLSADIDDIEFSDIDYDGDYESQSVGVLLDWYPASKGWKRNIFVSGGFMYFDKEFEGRSSARLNDVVSIGNSSFINPRTSALNLKIDYEDQVTPFFGVGWGNKSRGERGFAFVSEIGLMYIDDPEVTLTSNVSTNVISAAEIERERNDILDEESGVAIFGSVGVSYHF